jgi:hypothetical protein
LYRWLGRIGEAEQFGRGEFDGAFYLLSEERAGGEAAADEAGHGARRETGVRAFRDALQAVQRVDDQFCLVPPAPVDRGLDARARAATASMVRRSWPTSACRASPRELTWGC